MTTVTKPRLKIKPKLDVNAWKYMRLSAILLVPLVWFHTIFTTLVIGAENVSLDLVSARWATLGWRIYDVILLAFAFSHGVTGLRQVLFDFAASSITRRLLNVLMLLFWLLLSLVGAIGIIGGVGQ
jgi:succinate dehydrogenase / fumarate reductase membrane anchor subunit